MLKNEVKKNEQRDQYYKQLTTKFKELENKRTDNVFNKNSEKNHYKKEISSKILQRFESK